MLDKSQGMLYMFLIFGVLMMIILFKTKIEFFINMVLRMMMGTIGVCFVNGILLSQGMESGIGVNLLTLGVIGTLGLPGFLLLYGMVFYELL